MLIPVILAYTLLDLGPTSEVLVPDYNSLVSNAVFSNAVNAVAQTPIGPSPEWDKKADLEKQVAEQVATNSWWNVDYVVSNVSSDTPITNYYGEATYQNKSEGVWELEDTASLEPVYGTLLYSNLLWGCTFNSSASPETYFSAPQGVELLELNIDGSDDLIHLTRNWLYAEVTNSYTVVYGNELELKSDKIKHKTEFEYEPAQWDTTDKWFWEWAFADLSYIGSEQYDEIWQSEPYENLLASITISVDGAQTNCTLAVKTIDGNVTNQFVTATRTLSDNPIVLDFGAFGTTNFVFHRCASVSVSTNDYGSAYLDDVNRAMSYAEVLFGMSSNNTAQASCWCLIPEDGDYRFGNQYFKLGETMFAANCPETAASFVDSGKYFVALQLDYTGSASLVGFNTVGELITASTNPAFVIKPLYQFDGDMKVVCDFRSMPQAQVIEVF